jgi:hypothetical protein
MGKLHLYGQTSPLWANFNPRDNHRPYGQIHAVKNRALTGSESESVAAVKLGIEKSAAVLIIWSRSQLQSFTAPNFLMARPAVSN